MPQLHIFRHGEIGINKQADKTDHLASIGIQENALRLACLALNCQKESISAQTAVKIVIVQGSMTIQSFPSKAKGFVH